MPANLKDPFGESCCDGGATAADANARSAQPCGCDPGANWVCKRHSAPLGVVPPTVWRGTTASTPLPDLALGIGGAPTRASILPEVPADRKQFPVASGVLDYFPDALAAVANVSWRGNEQHNPGQPLHWARSKSADEADTMIRHFLQRGSMDTDGLRHTAKMAWRALALLQKEIEQESK